MKLLEFAVKYYFKPKTAFWLTCYLVVAGVGLICRPLWEPFVATLAEKLLDREIPEYDAWIPWALIGIGISIFIFDRLLSFFEQNGKETDVKIGINYMRLFGAFEVPLLMSFISRTPKFDKAFGDEEWAHFNVANEEYGPVNSDIINFWKNDWEFKDALPVLNPLWAKYRGNQDAGKDLYFSALEPSTEDFLSFAASPPINQSGCEAKEVSKFYNIEHADEDWDLNPPGLKSKDIGFLFLIITNDSDEKITDLEFKFTEFENQYSTRAYEYGNLFKDLSSYQSPSEIALHGVDQNTVGVEKIVKVSAIEAGKSLIWLTSIYRADREGLPDVYLENVLRLDRITAKKGRATFKRKIREPYGKLAAKVEVPYGWFSQ